MKRNNNSDITIVIFMLALAVLLAGVGFKLSQIHSILEDQFNYRTELDMCYEMAQEYYAPCHLERDNNGKYHWYFNLDESYKGE